MCRGVADWVATQYKLITPYQSLLSPDAFPVILNSVLSLTGI
jgi:hypothetical protein